MKHIRTFLASLFILSSACFTVSAHEMQYAPRHAHTNPTSLNTQRHSLSISVANLLGPIGLVCAGIHSLYSWCKSDGPNDAPASIPTATQSALCPSFVPPQRITRHEARNLPLTHYHQRYKLDGITKLFLQQHALNVHKYQSCTGTLMQHALHQECIALAHDTAHLNTHTHPHIEHYQAILAHVIDAGRACTYENVIDKACSMLDWAHAFVRYARAATSGIADGVGQTLHTLTHPGKFIAQLSHDAHELVCITLRVFYECGLIETLIDVDNDTLLDAYISDRSVYLNTLANRIQHYITTLTKPEGIRTSVASVTHMLLTGKCLHAIGKFFSFAARNISCMIKPIGDLSAVDATIATTANGILVNAAQETAQLTLRAAEQQLTKAKLMQVVAAYEPPAVHIERIAKKYPQWATDNCKPLIHVLKGEINSKGKLLGLHHDHLGYLESMGKIRVVKTYDNDMYLAEVLHNGKWKEKTFFPRHWTPEEVVAEINNAMTQVVQWTMEEMRKTADVKVRGIKTRLVLELDNRIVTVYPLA